MLVKLTVSALFPLPQMGFSRTSADMIWLNELIDAYTMRIHVDTHSVHIQTEVYGRYGKDISNLFCQQL